MRELSVPIPHFHDHQIAEVDLKVNGDKITYNFRVESFPWDIEDELSDKNSAPVSKSLARITRLRSSINN